jgi:hypothetical protein
MFMAWLPKGACYHRRTSGLPSARCSAPSSSGSLTMFDAIRLASSFVMRFAAAHRR